MVVLANHPNWQVYPDEIAKRKGVNRKTIDKYFKIFEEAGYLRTVKKSLGRGRGVQTFRFFSDTKITDFQFEIMLQRLDEAIAMKKSELSTIT
ncbi:TPA: transcriptional regulator [Streptococcus pneumoniae]